MRMRKKVIKELRAWLVCTTYLQRMERNLRINVSLNSERDSKLLEGILSLLNRHSLNESTSDSLMNDDESSPRSRHSTSSQSESTATDERASGSSLSSTVNSCSFQEQLRMQSQEAAGSAAPTTSDVMRTAAHILPEAYLNQSELALLPCRRAARRLQHAQTHASNSSILAATRSIPDSAMTKNVSHISSSHRKVGSSGFWLKDTSNTAIQEWLAKKNKEHHHRMRQLVKEKRMAEKSLRQKEQEAYEKARKAQESYRSWVDQKDLSRKRNRLVTSTLQESTFSIKGVSSPTSPSRHHTNPARLRKLKRVITFDDWVDVKRKENHQKHKPIQNNSSLHTQAARKAVNPVKKKITHSEWLALKNKEKHKQRKTVRADNPSAQSKNKHSPKTLDSLGLKRKQKG